MPSKDMSEILSRCRTGDSAAQEQLVLDTQDRIYYYALKMLRSEQDALDITQEVLITMLTSLDKLQNDGAFYSWIGGITANMCRNALNRGPHKKEVQVVDDEDGNSLFDTFEDIDEQKAPEKALDNDETRRMIMDLIDALPDAQRECVLLYYYEEMSVKDIAATLNVSENTVKSRLNYARKAIKIGVEDYEKKGTKLYSISILPFLLYFLREDASACHISAEALQKLAKSAVSAATAAGGIAASSATTATASGSAAATAGSAKTATGVAAHKGIAAAVAIAVVSGIVAGVMVMNKPTPVSELESASKSTDSSASASASTSTSDASEVETTPDPVEDNFAVAYHEVLGIDDCEQVSNIFAYNPTTGDRIPNDEVEWTVSDPTVVTYDPVNGAISYATEGKRGTATLTAKWGNYTDTATIEYAYQYEIAPITQGKVQLPVNTETPEYPRITEDGQINCLVLDNTDMFHYYAEPDPLAQDGITYYDTIEKIEWIVDDPSIVEAIPHISDSGEYCCTFKTLAPGRTFLTCKVTRTGGLIAHQYCDIEVYDENA